MKKLLILLSITMLFDMTPAVAATESGYACSSYVVQETCSSSYTYTTYGGNNASSTSYTCYKELDTIDGNVIRRLKFATTVTCQSGYGKNSNTHTECVGSATAGPSDITYYTCGCTDTTSWTGTWANYGSGYQRQSGTRNNCGTTSTVYQYRCAVGYYSSTGIATGSTTAKVGCTLCTTTCGVGHTSAAGAASYTACRAEANTEYFDGTGTFQYTTACCCDGTCDEKCASGKSCQTHTDCDSGFCGNGCCMAGLITEACTFDDTNYCSSNTDCLLGTCNTTTHCCDSTLELTCAKLSEDYCTSNADCPSGICNLNTNCCRSVITLE